MVKNEAGKYGYHAHYAVKANANPRILSIIAENGLGADCVSGGEVKAALMQVSRLIRSFLPVWAKLTGRSTWDWITIFLFQCGIGGRVGDNRRTGCRKE